MRKCRWRLEPRLVPAINFAEWTPRNYLRHEWTGPKGKRQPLWIRPRAGGVILFAGLYKSRYPERNHPEVTFTIVTCTASATIAEIHDRMPVVLDERAAEDWMNPRERNPLSLKRLLVPAPPICSLRRPATAPGSRDNFLRPENLHFAP
jgi:putative SOS response-associated peptidase YedK